MYTKIEKNTDNSSENNFSLLNSENIKVGENLKDNKLKIVWKNVILFTLLHLAALNGLYCCFFNHVKFQTLVFSLILYMMGGLGITAGAHRLWAHRTYKAKLPLRVLLAFFQTSALQNSIFEWSRDHRVHHKYSETDADPHNAKRGLFFSHIGWLLCKKNKMVLEKGSKIPLDDLIADPVVFYQKKFYKPLAILCCFILPTVIPHVFWNESLANAYFVAGLLRYTLLLHATWCVNSIAHFWGQKPYDRTINPVENLIVSFFAIGEGFHNYHHTFPQDYSTSEYGSRYLNFTKFFIDLMAWIGLAYDRNKMNDDIILKRRLKTGDLSL